jgi:hypothetical protein
MPPPPIGKASELDTPGPLRWPADPGDDAQLDHGGMGVYEDHNDGAPDQGTGALGIPHESLVAGDGGGAGVTVGNMGAQPQSPCDQGTGAPGASHEGLVALVGGSAVAAGQHTLTTGLVQNFAEDRGTYSIARGEAIFEASAHSTEPGGAVAAADTFLVVSHADFIIENERSYGGHGSNDAWAVSELDYVAIDIKGWSPTDGTMVIEWHQLGHYWQTGGNEPPCDNNAYVMALAEAHGAGSLSATLTNALTFENHFSFVNAMGMVAV